MTDDYYHFDERSYALIGERTGKMYKIGEEVEVRVVGVNLDERTVDFEIIGGGSFKQKDKNDKQDKNVSRDRKSKKRKRR